MSAGDAAWLSVIWLGCVAVVGHLARRPFHAARFSIHLCFSVTYLVTFYLGFPLSVVLVLGFAVAVVPPWYLGGALLLPLLCYLVYYAAYTVRLPVPAPIRTPMLRMDCRETTVTCWLLALVAAGTLAVFIARNGLLLLEIHSYHQAFSPQVSGQALKRFSYFLIPSMLIVYFQAPGFTRWLAFLAVTAGFGTLAYIAIGGTRADLAVAFALFVLIGLTDGHLKTGLLLPLSMLGVLGMGALALARYDLPGSGTQQVHNLLFLTRDTLSPWENLGVILQRHDRIAFQGPAPVIRDFYVYIPKTLWPGRPDQILNTANYFTWHVLHHGPGLTISPTLVGSLFVMGGLLAVVLGGLVCGLVVRWFDRLYDSAGQGAHQQRDAVVKAFCYGSLFHVMVLVREGPDSFASHFAFFSSVFALCVLLAKLACRLSASSLVTLPDKWRSPDGHRARLPDPWRGRGRLPRRERVPGGAVRRQAGADRGDGRHQRGEGCGRGA